MNRTFGDALEGPMGARWKLGDVVVLARDLELTPEPPDAVWSAWSANHSSESVSEFFAAKFTCGVKLNTYSGEGIATVRAKLLTLFGQPNGAVDGYVRTFLYELVAETPAGPALFAIGDRKAREVSIIWEWTTGNADSRYIAESTIWKLISLAPGTDFRDEFTYVEGEESRPYGFTNGQPWVKY